MNDSVFQDSMTEAVHTVGMIAEQDSLVNVWIWIAIVEFIIIVWLLFVRRNKSEKSTLEAFKNESLKQEVDFKNIINSSFNSASLYDELKARCHPDRFPLDKEKNEVAVHLFQEIAKNRRNFSKLLDLKEQAKLKLNINFKD